MPDGAGRAQRDGRYEAGSHAAPPRWPLDGPFPRSRPAGCRGAALTIPAKYRERLWLSTAEVAQLAPVTRRKLAELCKSGELRGRKEGGEWWVEAASAWAWLDCQSPEPEKLLPLVAQMLGRSVEVTSRERR